MSSTSINLSRKRLDDLELLLGRKKNQWTLDSEPIETLIATGE